jgi:hypothetical protein
VRNLSGKDKGSSKSADYYDDDGDGEREVSLVVVESLSVLVASLCLGSDIGVMTVLSVRLCAER